jgi:hypothetical protein
VTEQITSENILDKLALHFEEQTPTVCMVAQLEITRLRTWVHMQTLALEAVEREAIRLHGHWDYDEDHKVGKGLLALMGHLDNYHPDATVFRTALEACRKEKPDGKED